MKKIILAAVFFAVSLNAIADEPNEKVLQAFTTTFSGVQDVSWITNADTYEVKFSQNKVVARVSYDKEGNILKTLRYYTEKELPLLILSKVKSKYTETQIHSVVEEATDNGLFYHIVLEGKKDWIQVQSDSFGSLSVTKKFKKA